MHHRKRRWYPTRGDRLRDWLPVRRPRRPPRRRRRCQRLGALSAALLCVSVLMIADSPARRPPAIGIPAYFYPTPGNGTWPRLLDAADTAIVVVNPASGPGARLDPAYESVTAQLRRERSSVYGYVDTAYGQRNATDVLQDAVRFHDWYHVNGIFLDQTAPTAERLTYYRALVGALHHDGLQVAINPGQPEIDRRYLDLVEHVVLFEGPYETYLWTHFPQWVQDYSASKIWHLVYRVPDAGAMTRVLGLAGAHNAGVVFITDGQMPNPWDSLPPYWDLERKLTAGGQARV